MVITITTDEPTNDDIGTRTRMRKRFQELDAQRLRREQAGGAWVFVLYIGFLITFIGVFMMGLFLGIIPLRLDIIISTAVILIGVFFMVVAVFIRRAPNLVLSEM